MAVRVAGTDGAFSWGGSLWANLFPGGAAPFLSGTGPRPPTGFDTVEFHMLMGACGFEHVITYGEGPEPSPLHPYYDQIMTWLQLSMVNIFEFRAWVKAGWGDASVEASQTYFAVFQWGDLGPAVWHETLPNFGGGFSIAVAGAVVKRTWLDHHPDHRQHMHPRDAAVADAWYLTPGAEASASFAGLSVSSSPRRAAYPGLSDAEIGDQYFGDPSMGGSMARVGAHNVNHDIATLTVSGANFSGLERGWSDDELMRTYGSGGTLRGRAIDSPGSPFSGWSFVMYPAMDYAWDAQCCLFDEAEPLDPPVWAGFVGPTGAAAWYPLSSLPTQPTRPALTATGTVYDSLPIWDAHGQNPIFSAEIDEEWALRNWLCPGREEEVTATASEVMDDRYLAFIAPGVNSGTFGARVPVGQVTAIDRACLPLAPGLTGDPERRWTCDGDIAEAEDSTLARPRFTLPAGGSGAVSYRPITRMWDRLALIPQPDTQQVFEWIWSLKAAAESEEPEGHPAYAEDVFHFGGFGYLRLRVNRPLDLPLELALVLRYSTIEVDDPHYTDGGARIEAWSYTRTSGRVVYPFTIGVGSNEAVIDLLCPADPAQDPRLYIVDELSIEGFQNDRADPVAIELPELTLLRDPAGTGLLATVKETWDFLTDFQGMSLSRDGNTNILRWPDEPWLNGGPERGHGYIQPRQHSPDSGLADLLHSARSLDHLAAANSVEGFTASANGEALVTAPGPGGEPETLCDPLMYWGADQPWQVEDGSAELRAGIVCVEQRIARGLPYRFMIRKVLGGAGWGLLRDAEGQRVVQGSAAAEGSWWRLWSRVAAYRDEDGHEIEAPAGLRAVNVWQLEHEGGVNDRLDRQGVFRTPGLKPSTTRIWNAARGTAPVDHTDTARVEYLLQVWDSEGSPWAAYDLNDAEDWAALQTDPALLSSATFEIASRRLTQLWLQVDVGLAEGGNLVRLRAGTQVVSRGGQVWTRVRETDAWTARHETQADIPLLLHVDGTDDLALLDDAVYRSSRLGDEPWDSGLPGGIAEEVAEWLGTGRVTGALIGRGDMLPVAVAVAPGGSGAVLSALTREAPVEVASLEADPGRLWPWIARRIDGTWQIGVFDGGTYREWLSTRLDGTAWAAGETQEIGAGADLTGCGHWHGRDGDELVAGYHRTGIINVFYRGGVARPWNGPYLGQAAPQVQPYAYLRATGGAEVGWLDPSTGSGQAWRIWRADRPDSDWSEA